MCQPAVERRRARLCACAFSRTCCELFSINRQVDCVASSLQPRLLLRVLAHSASLVAKRGKFIARFGKVGVGDLIAPAMPVAPRVSPEEKRIARDMRGRGCMLKQNAEQFGRLRSTIIRLLAQNGPGPRRGRPPAPSGAQAQSGSVLTNPRLIPLKNLTHPTNPTNPDF